MRKVKSVLTAVFLLLTTFSLFSEGKAESYVDLALQAEQNGMLFFWDPTTGSGILEKEGHTVSFKANDNLVLHDYSLITQEDSPKVQDGKLLVTQSFLNSVNNFFLKSNDSNPYKIGAILIDPGHGGKDPGASATHKINGKNVLVQEKDINLKVGLYMRDLLKKAYPDKQIIMTRETDVFISLAARTEIANSVKLKENEAIIYISIHVNASLNPAVNGYEVWYLSPGYRRQVLGSDEVDDPSLQPILNSMLEEEYTTESVLIAKFIMEGMDVQIGKQSASRGIKEEEWFVVKHSNMPSVLVEIGFLTNAKEGPLLADDEYLKKVSFGIYNGVQAFVTHFERSRGFTENE